MQDIDLNNESDVKKSRTPMHEDIVLMGVLGHDYTVRVPTGTIGMCQIGRDVAVADGGGMIKSLTSNMLPFSGTFLMKQTVRDGFEQAVIDWGDDIKLVKGIQAFIGAGGSGKSTTSANIARLAAGLDFVAAHDWSSVSSESKLGRALLSTGISRVAHLDVGESTPGSASVHQIIPSALLATALEGNCLLVIDSVKPIFFKNQDNLGQGGVSKAVMQDLSAISAVLAERNCVVIVVVNVLTRKKEAYDEMFEALKSSLNGIYELASDRSFRGEIRDYVTGERPNISGSLQKWMTDERVGIDYVASTLDAFHDAAGQSIGKSLRSTK